MPNINILKGNELSDQQIAFMNKQRLLEYGENTKDFKKNEQESIFFFLNEGDSVKAFGMLKPVGITHGDKSYRILGIGNIIAVEKGEGYSKTLMESIRTYLISTKTSGLGFCDASVCDFYVRCGYQVIKGLSGRFRYLHAASDGQSAIQHNPYGVIYLDGGDDLMAHVLKDDAPIYTDQPFW